MFVKRVSFLAAASLAHAAAYVYGRDSPSGATLTVVHTSTASADIAAAAATALTESSTSNVKGKAFDRILQIFLETTSYDNAIADRKCFSNVYLQAT